MVARVMELVNATRKAIDSGPGAADPAVREAVETVAILLSLVAPYTAEDMWEELGHEPTVAKAGWPKVDPALLVQDSVTCVVQIAGKVKDRLEVSPDISDADLEQLALASEAVSEGPGRPRHPQGHRPRAEAGQHRPGLSRHSLFTARLTVLTSFLARRRKACLLPRLVQTEPGASFSAARGVVVPATHCALRVCLPSSFADERRVCSLVCPDSTGARGARA